MKAASKWVVEALEQYPRLVWLALVYMVAVYWSEILGGGDPWKTADWLINYADGPVRRGLIGEMLLAVAPSQVLLLALVFSLQVGIYIAVFWLILVLYTQVSRELTWAAILFAPAYLLFPTYDLLAGFRKEILFFLSFALFAVGYAKGQLSDLRLGAVWALFAFSGFVYEINLFLLPFFLYLLQLSVKDRLISTQSGLGWAIGFILAAVLAAFFAWYLPGDEDSRVSICTALIQTGFGVDICGGAIAWVGMSLPEAIGQAARYFPTTLFVYPGLFLMALLPLLGSTWAAQHRGFLTGALLWMSPLFIIALDWGRWIHIYVFFAFTLFLAVSSRQDVGLPKWPVGLVVAYISLWSLHHFLPVLNGGLLHLIGGIFL